MCEILVRTPEDASMGPRFNGVEDTESMVDVIPSSPASMGPRFNGVEDKQPLLAHPVLLSRFNVATL